MSHSLPRRVALLVAAGAATLLLALALSSAAASASPFCGGQVISKYSACWGAARTFSIVQGHGNETSVCVGYNEVRGPCSGGPNQNVAWNIGSGYRSPMIIGNAASTTVGWGEVF
jgi:hypothetical protein